MELWQSLLVAFGGNAALLLVLGFLGRSLIAQYLTKDIETFKAQLQAQANQQMVHLEAQLRIRATEHEVRFSRLHDQRARVIARLHRLLRVAFRETESFLNPMQFAGELPQSEKFSRALKAIGRCGVYFDQRRIYLSEEMCGKVERFLKNLRLPALHFAAYDEIEYAPPETMKQKSDVWHKSWETIQTDAANAIDALEHEFRVLLGDVTD